MTRWRARGIGVVVFLCGVACGSTTTTPGATGVPGGDAGTDSGADTGPHARVFGTSMTYTGDLKDAVPGSASGLAAADQLCQKAATSAALSGTFVAWLSDSKTSAKDRVTDVAGGWYSVGANAAQVAPDKATLLKNGPAAPVNDENGKTVLVCPWSGTLSDGTKALTGGNAGADGHCDDWTVSNIDLAVVGGLISLVSEPPGCATSPTEDGVSYSQCMNAQSLYCFQR